MSRRVHQLLKSSCYLKTSKGSLFYTLARSTKRRSWAICVEEDARVGVYVPFRARNADIIRFIKERLKWTLSKVEEAQEQQEIIGQKKFDDGHRFLFLGKKHLINTIVSEKSRPVEFDGFNWTVYVPSELEDEKREKYIKDQLTKWYKKQAKEILGGRIFHYSRIMGIAPKKIAIRTQKRIWGNCDYNTQTINLNWQIILSPIKVVDYIVVHEMCHLFIPNHSRRFWQKVAKFMPDYKQYQDWLKVNQLDMVLP